MDNNRALRRDSRTSDLASPPVSVILIEDDNALREGLADYLRLSGITVTEAPSGLAFYKALRGKNFDIAIVDINLPDASGYDLIRDIAEERRMGIIALSAKTGRDDRKRGYSEGADLYLSKPVDGEELLTTVRNLARRVGSGATPAAAQGDRVQPWRLNRYRSRLVAPNGSMLDLSGREVMLLEQFAKAKGEAIARPVLADIMGYGTPSAENRGLDAALRRLRQKAVVAGVELPLQGVHAVGVRFIDPLVVD
ncbi:response regulator transcription factor [Rhizobium viscosum]|uniref:Two-component system torCAD operon response regulator TorR n=1 Tax=Rhizobium viscosum TaxID=1673 RepID=A0ABR9IYF9_RHIVS|nr:response regulator transcription factor [Rhizobium viscosum]MBE1508254.1 two-component system torCAD operon response regulator TorR [Rhizobium viscosum]